MENEHKLSLQDRCVNALPFVSLVILVAVGVVMAFCL